MDMTTFDNNGTDTTGDGGNAQEQKDAKKIFITGVIIAIVVAAVFVLLAFIRVMIYCCSNPDSSDSKPFADST
jgi:hypothetical protein